MVEKDKKIVIGIAGNIGAGKGTVTKYLTNKYPTVNVVYSDILLDILNRMHLENNRKNLASLAEGLRDTFGSDILSMVLAEDIKSRDAEIVVFDGIRKKAELDYFKNNTDNFVFIFVDVSIEIAYKRLIKRGEKVDDNSKTFEEFKEDNNLPADKDVPGLKSEADYIIDNSGNIENMHKQIDDIMKTLRT